MQKKIFILTHKPKGLREHCINLAFHLCFKRKFSEASIQVLFFKYKVYQRLLGDQVCVYLTIFQAASETAKRCMFRNLFQGLLQPASYPASLPWLPAPQPPLLLRNKIASFQAGCYHIHGMVNFRLPENI